MQNSSISRRWTDVHLALVAVRRVGFRLFTGLACLFTVAMVSAIPFTTNLSAETAPLTVSGIVNTAIKPSLIRNQPVSPLAPTNATPTIGPIANQTTLVDQPVIIKLEVADAETAVTDLQLSLTTTNPTLITPQVYTFHYFFVDNHRYLTMSGVFGLTGTATNTVTVSDGVNSASTNFTITVVAPPAGTARFANTSPMTIPDLGAASIYPSVINASSMSGVITKVELTASRFSHDNTTDVNMLLVGPTGTGVVFLSNVGGPNPTGRNPPATDSSTVTFSVSDTAGFPFATVFPIWSEIFTPTNLRASDFFPAPAPAAPYAPVAFSSFNGLTANGPWSLYVYDSVAGNQGMIEGGWSLLLTTTGGSNQAPTINGISNRSINANTSTGGDSVHHRRPRYVACELGSHRHF